MTSATYTGGCHCKANRYSITVSPPLDDGHRVISCNCSICSTNGYLLVFVDEVTITWEKGGMDQLKGYKFGKGKLNHFFCPECGTSVGAQGELGGVKKTGLNVSLSFLSMCSRAVC